MLPLHRECQWDKDNSLPWFGDFFTSLEECKMTENPGLQKIVISGAQRNFSLLLGQHPYNGVLFFCQKYRRHLVGLGDNMHSHMDHFLAYFGVSIASHTPSPNCRSDLTPFSHRFLLFFGFFYSFIFFLIN